MNFWEKMKQLFKEDKKDQPAQSTTTPVDIPVNTMIYDSGDSVPTDSCSCGSTDCSDGGDCGCD